MNVSWRKVGSQTGCMNSGTSSLTHFPFTDLSGGKLRPALVISRDNSRDVILAFITSQQHTVTLSNTLSISPNRTHGLKALSVIRFDKIVTLERTVIVGKLGKIDSDVLQKARSVFLGVFGF